jgi:hypothetical protein
VVVAEKVAEETTGERRDRRAEHMREEDPAVNRPKRCAAVDRCDEIRRRRHRRDPIQPVNEGEQEQPLHVVDQRKGKQAQRSKPVVAGQ